MLRTRLKPIQNSSGHTHVVLVGYARKAKCQPVELDRTDRQLAVSHVHTATKHHGHPTSADRTSGSMSAAKQSVRKWSEVLPLGRDRWPKGVTVKLRTRAKTAAKICGSSQPTRKV